MSKQTKSQNVIVDSRYIDILIGIEEKKNQNFSTMPVFFLLLKIPNCNYTKV